MRSIYVSHNGLSEPLGQAQVVPYLRGLARRGVAIDVVACEPAGREEQASAVARSLAAEGIRYLPLRRRPTRALSGKLLDAAALVRGAAGWAIAGRAPILHARSHLPAAAADLLARLVPRARVLFDLRGLLAEEYISLGNWRPGELRHRLTAGLERRLLARADRVVVLTHTLKEELCRRGGPLSGRDGDVAVIPCCVDLGIFRPPDEETRAARRQRLGVPEHAPLLCFSGSTARYDLRAALGLHRALSRMSDARMLFLSREDPQQVRALWAGAGLSHALRVVAAEHEEVPSWLAACDIGVAPLRDDPCCRASSPTKIAEYLAIGLPTVVSDKVADLEFLRGPALFPVDIGHGAALAALAERLLAGLASERGRLAAAARESAVRHFSLEDIGVPRYHALYLSLS